VIEGTHDTLRDELAKALGQARALGLGAITEAEACNYMAEAVFPVVRRYADAQVATERERIAALLVDAAFVEAVKDYLRGLSDEPWPPYPSEVLAAAGLLAGEPQ
jgi:hypothetical protein